MTKRARFGWYYSSCPVPPMARCRAKDIWGVIELAVAEAGAEGLDELRVCEVTRPQTFSGRHPLPIVRVDGEWMWGVTELPQRAEGVITCTRPRCWQWQAGGARGTAPTLAAAMEAVGNGGGDQVHRLGKEPRGAPHYLALYDALGGQMAAAATIGVARCTLLRWATGRVMPPSEAWDRMRALAAREGLGWPAVRERAEL